jgi:hypothetical protein
MLIPSTMMMEIPMTAMIERKEYWQGQLDRLKESGLSRSQYCRDNSINYDRFGYWLKKLSPASPTFVPVKMQTPEISITQFLLCTIELRGHVLQIHDASALSILLDRMI